MKEIPETAVPYVQLSNPNAKVIERDGQRILQMPMYDIETDRAWVEERRVVRGPEQTPQGILPVFNVRTGPKANMDGDAKTSPLGHLYRIIGYSPPPKDDAE